MNRYRGDRLWSIASALLALPVLLWYAPAQAQGPSETPGLDYVRQNYTKHEFYIPMRDGVRLFTQVYAPKDASKKYAILMNRTPYSIGPYGADRLMNPGGTWLNFFKEGYILVRQDVRGRWMSEGTFEHVRPHKGVKSGPTDIDESTDTYDTIEWLIKNVPGNTGRVGMWGISYPGFYAAAGMIDAHPALKAVSPQAPVADWFSSDDWHHNGAFLLAHAFGWFSGAGCVFTKPTTVSPCPPFDRGTNDGYEFYLRLGPVRNANEKYFKHSMPFWDEMMKRDTKDSFWIERNIRQHLKNIKPAVMTVGGWFDAENLFGALEVYRATEKLSPGATNMLVMGPWVHGGWDGGKGDVLGDVRFDSNTAEFYRENIELAFFNYYLKDKGTMDLPEAYVFETGRNIWRKFDTWPPRGVVQKSLYLRADGRLTFEPPVDGADAAYDEYTSDPKKPVPLTPGIASGMAVRYMTDDQRHAARRPDVLVYVSDVLEEDLTVAGPIWPSLYVSTTGTDQDFIVKLIDVYPDRFPDERGSMNNTLGGYQQLVRGEVMRGKFRNSLEKPEPFTPGKPTKVEFQVYDTFHTFRRGHRIMIQIHSTWFPWVDINPGRFMNIYEATEADFAKTTQRVYRSRAMPSALRVDVLPAQ
jgi:hypothetical protein